MLGRMNLPTEEVPKFRSRAPMLLHTARDYGGGTNMRRVLILLMAIVSMLGTSAGDERATSSVGDDRV